jgi:DNA mismatch endonuclease (patch repair protein)
MTDIVDIETRSRMMSGIRAQNTKPELLIRKLLHSKGFRFRLHVKTLPGKPDLVLPKYHAVVFVHGCFWHGHGCRLFKWPSTRKDFWRKKIRNNVVTDQKSNVALLEKGWRIAVVWECAIRGRTKNVDQVIDEISLWLLGEKKILEIKE